MSLPILEDGGGSAMSGDLAWIEDWCAENITGAAPSDENVTLLLAPLARLAAEAAGLRLGDTLASVGYATLEDYILDYVASRADAEVLDRDNARRRRTDYGRRAHESDPEAKYAFPASAGAPS